MEVDPIDPISMEVRFDNPVAPTRAIPLACGTVPVRIVVKSDALYDGIAELEWGGDAGEPRLPAMPRAPAHISA
eukprot:scaffold22448_cov146-Isochrysis_galbana.AAC.5